MTDPNVTTARDAFQSDLWIDEPGAAQRIGQYAEDEELRADLAAFIERGHVVFEGIVPEDTIEGIIEDIASWREAPERIVMKKAGKYLDPAGIEAMDRGHRMIDLYGRSAAARKAIFAPRIARFLETIFGEPAIAFQSLTFEYGSQQPMHRDTAYVVTRRPLTLAASWIALEDVTPGAGELVYSASAGPTSIGTRSGTARSSTRRSSTGCTPRRARAGSRSRPSCRRRATSSSVTPTSPMAAPVSARRTAPAAASSPTTPVAVKPNYQSLVADNYFELPDPSGHFFTSRHYDLRALHDGRATDGAAPI